MSENKDLSTFHIVVAIVFAIAVLRVGLYFAFDDDGMKPSRDALKSVMEGERVDQDEFAM